MDQLETRARHKEETNSIIVTITVFFLAVFIAFIMEYFDRVKHDPIESAKLAEIKGMFGRHRRE